MLRAPLTLAALAVCVIGCEDPAATTTDDDATSTTEATTMNDPAPSASSPAGSLQAEIDAIKASFAERASDETKRIYAEGIDAVADSGVVAQAKNVGDEAPAFTLPDATGSEVSLDSLLAEGPVVVVWYRGGWCPYCNLTLKAYQERLDEIRAAGATLVAISPETPDNALSTRDKQGLEFVVLTDANNAVAREYGVVFDLTEPVHENYNENFQLDAWNGQASGELPLAATYVIDRDGVIRWAFLDADYRERADPDEAVAALRTLDG